MKNLKIFLLSGAMMLAAVLVTPEWGHSQPPPPPSKPTQTPIDGGLGLLAAAGGAYAIKKLRSRKTVE
jgi:hypothetical protein